MKGNDIAARAGAWIETHGQAKGVCPCHRVPHMRGDEPFPIKTCEEINRCEKGRKLPGRPNWILCDQIVGGQDDQSMDNGLTNEHSIKRVFVVLGQGGQIQCGFLLQGERINAMLFSLGRNEP